MTVTTADRVDTWEMNLVHRVFRREFRLLPAVIRATAPGDRARAAELGRHLSMLTTGLHHHHTGEDELLWPLLLQRVALRADLVHRMEAQHGRLDTLLQQIDALLPAWVAGAAGGERDALAELLAQASAALDEHLADEENEILPLVAEHLSHAEWNALGERGKEHLPKDHRAFLFLGAILEEATPWEEREFLGMIPAPVRWAWKLVGRPVYNRSRRRIHGV